MTDEQELRALLFQAAELPDTVQPPVQRLIERGRASRTRRAALTAISAAVALAAVATLPTVLSGAARESAPSRTPSHEIMGPRESTMPGPNAAELARFRWSALPPSPLGPRSGPVLAWTGTELIELGGTRKGSNINDGAAFDIATGRWHRIAQVTGNVDFTNAITAWTGSELFVTNGVTASCPGLPATQCLPHAGLYDPATNRWTSTLLPAQMEGLTPTAAAWTGRDVVVGFAGTLGNYGKFGIAAYDPAANRWRVITPALPHGHHVFGLAMTATSNRLVLWSLWSYAKRLSKRSWEIYSGVDVLALDSTSHWTDVTGSWPQHWVVGNPVYAGSQILIPPGQIWCGTCSHPSGENRPQLASSGTLALTTIPAGPVDSPYQPAQFWLWNGSAAVAANVAATGNQGAGPERLAAWDPATGQWRQLPYPPGSVQLSDSPVWAGPQLLELTDTGALWSFHR